MFTARLRNSRNAEITLTGRETEYQIISIKGLNPPSAHLNTSNVAGLDGALYNSGRLNTRNIVITARINGDVERNRQILYDYCPTKEKVRFFFKNENRDVYIDGYVDSVECDLFTNSEKMQISIICPQPYFVDVADTQVDGSTLTKLFTFPFSIDLGSPIPFSEYVFDDDVNLYNDSSGEIGMIIEAYMRTDVSSLVIRNTGTGESFGLVYAFESGDRVTIDTIKGQKSITLLRDGVYYNLFSALQPGSKFFHLASGDNFFNYIVDGNIANNPEVDLKFTFFKMYRGV